MLSLEKAVGECASMSIRHWVCATGKRIAKSDAPWLNCPIGRSSKIGADFYSTLATQEHLQIRTHPSAGLLTDFNLLKSRTFDPMHVLPEIRDFYEHTSDYDLEAWSEAPIPTRLFLWLLTRFVSRQMDQLNFPVSSLELASGMTSEILPMTDENGTRHYTGWLRRLAANDRVIYTGFYSVERPPNYPGPCVKVSFPVPFGSSTVFLRPEVQADGSFRLISSGSGFGQAGFYRMVEIDDAHWRVRYIRTLRETFHLYVDRHGSLRTDHTVEFLGFTPLRLHYKLSRKREVAVVHS